MLILVREGDAVPRAHLCGQFDREDVPTIRAAPLDGLISLVVPTGRIAGVEFAKTPSVYVVLPKSRAEPKNHRRSRTMGPPSAPLTSYWLSSAAGRVRPMLLRYSSMLSDRKASPVPL